MLAIEVVGAPAAAMAGFLDLFAIPAGTWAFRTALIHMTLNLLVRAPTRRNSAIAPRPITDRRLNLNRSPTLEGVLMNIAALVAWLVTALGGFYMLGIWISRGGLRGTVESRLPAPVVFGHFALAAAGLIVWIVHLIAGGKALAWTAFALLLPVALLGFVMLARWIPVRRARAVALAGGPGAAAEPAERHIPTLVVAAHGLFAVATVILVLLGALGVGGS